MKKVLKRKEKRILSLTIMSIICAVCVTAAVQSAFADTEIEQSEVYVNKRVIETVAYTVEQIDIPVPDPEDIEILAKTVYGEAGGVPNTAHQAAVIWCILNRVDDPRWPDTIEEVVIPSQFNGYDPENPITPELYELSLDVYNRWQQEKAGAEDVGRILPKEYVFFHGDGKENHFRTEYEHTGNYWDWTLPDPYI